jgi:hypothetical protein
MVIAKLRLSIYLSLDETELEQARNQARELFGSSPEDDIQTGPASDVNFIYIGTPDGQTGGWVVIVTQASYDNLLRRLRGPLSKMYDLDIHFLNRTDGDTDLATLVTMVPFGSWHS